MSQAGVDKYFAGSIVVNESVRTRSISTDDLNGEKIEDYITKKHLPNPEVLKNFTATDGGLIWNGVKLVPPNVNIDDRTYTENEITEMVENLWDGYDGSVDDDKVDSEVNTKPSGSLGTDWKNGGVE